MSSQLFPAPAPLVPPVNAQDHIDGQTDQSLGTKDGIFITWTDALAEYQPSTNINLLDPKTLPPSVQLKDNMTSEEVLSMLQRVSDHVKKKRRMLFRLPGKERAVKQMVDGLFSYLGFCGKVCVSVVPGG
ncbi:hypothetical protein PENSPDRAFT_683097 [Peniophora sp. CONT]|nr:hypothetical protein PENSPDRAFT_683097 [Peniophora sp. CONT]